METAVRKGEASGAFLKKADTLWAAHAVGIPHRNRPVLLSSLPLARWSALGVALRLHVNHRLSLLGAPVSGPSTSGVAGPFYFLASEEGRKGWLRSVCFFQLATLPFLTQGIRRPDAPRGREDGVLQLRDAWIM